MRGDGTIAGRERQIWRLAEGPPVAKFQLQPSIRTQTQATPDRQQQPASP
jgi:hypothetical protein